MFMALFGVISAALSAASVFMGLTSFMKGVTEHDIGKAVAGAVGMFAGVAGLGKATGSFDLWGATKNAVGSAFDSVSNSFSEATGIGMEGMTGPSIDPTTLTNTGVSNVTGGLGEAIQVGDTIQAQPVDLTAPEGSMFNNTIGSNLSDLSVLDIPTVPGGMEMVGGPSDAPQADNIIKDNTDKATSLTDLFTGDNMKSIATLGKLYASYQDGKIKKDEYEYQKSLIEQQINNKNAIVPLSFNY